MRADAPESLPRGERQPVQATYERTLGKRMVEMTSGRNLANPRWGCRFPPRGLGSRFPPFSPACPPAGPFGWVLRGAVAGLGSSRWFSGSVLAFSRRFGGPVLFSPVFPLV